MAYIIGRVIEGISLNGLEYLLDDDEKILEFDSINVANSYLLEHGLSQEIIDNEIIIKEGSHE